MGFNLAEEPSCVLYIIYSPEFLEHVKSTQRLGLRNSEPVLSIPKLSLLIHRVGQKVWVVDRLRLGVLEGTLGMMSISFDDKNGRKEGPRSLPR